MELSGPDLGFDDGVTFVFKLEYLQHSGSFKARGATHFVGTQPIADAGVVAASGGNHGAAVAWAARRFGHVANIFVPTISSPAKVERLRTYGAVVHQVGAVYAESLQAAEAFQADTGATSVHAYNHPVVLAGAGTTALEFEAQAGPLDAVLIACGGGGLAGGMACWLGDRTEMVVCETDGTRAYAAAKAQGRPVPVEVSGLAADALGATEIGEMAWRALSGVGAKSVTVTDDELADAKARLWDDFRIVVEPSAATPMAALWSGRWNPEQGQRIGVLLCGANTPLA